MIFPMRSSVTYLTDAGSPTAVMDSSFRTMSNVWDKSFLQAGEAGAAATMSKVMKEMWLSFPSANKHITFQGDFFHGIFDTGYPSETADVKNDKKEKRATLLINFWSVQDQNTASTFDHS